ncbi:MAG: hypothetical protein WC900_05140 [Oscillospiraceae bacterium]|jgi:hypothetical protein
MNNTNTAVSIKCSDCGKEMIDNGLIVSSLIAGTRKEEHLCIDCYHHRFGWQKRCGYSGTNSVDPEKCDSDFY